MGLCSIIENISFVFNCFLSEEKRKRKRYMQMQYDVGRKLVDIGQQYNITTLPVMIGREIADLYPPTNHVEKWNVFIVGKNKNYILTHVNDLDIPNIDYLLNNIADPFLPKEINDFFNHVWDKTLDGHDLQFFMIWNNKTYFVNSYRFTNGIGDVVGAIMFMRLLDLIPDFISQQEKNTIDFIAEKNIYKSNRSK